MALRILNNIGSGVVVLDNLIVDGLVILLCFFFFIRI